MMDVLNDADFVQLFSADAGGESFGLGCGTRKFSIVLLIWSWSLIVVCLRTRRVGRFRFL